MKSPHHHLRKLRGASNIFAGVRKGMKEEDFLNQLAQNELQRGIRAQKAILAGADPREVQIEIERGLGLPVTDPSRK